MEESSDFRTWWVVKEGAYDGWQQSIISILHVLKTQGPFHGIIGFSQGAMIGSLLLGILERGSFPEFEGELPRLECAILVSGCVSRDPSHSIYYSKETKSTTPSLVVMGDTDEMVPAAGSMAMSEYFQAPKIYRYY